MFSFIKSLFSKKAPQTPPQPHFPRGTRSAWAFKELERVTGPGEYLIRTLQVHRMRLKKGVGEHLLRNWPTSY